MASNNQTDPEKAPNGASDDYPHHDFRELNGHERCKIEEVALVVPETDDPTMPVMTFRAWFLGLTSCTLLNFLNTFFSFRTQPLAISALSNNSLPLGPEKSQ
ncbi:hypothetical protein FF1_005362 [Malus domestica]